MERDLQYCKPASLREALELMRLHGEEIKPYCGGTDLLVQMHENAERLIKTRCFLDVSGIRELREITAEPHCVTIGAAVTHQEIVESAAIRELAGFLCEASATVGSLQIRNIGTIGGNICNASLAADTLSPLVALDAVAVTASLGGERRIPVKDIFAGGGENTLLPDELVRCITFERIDGYKTAFIKLGRRKALAISRMNVAVAVKLDQGVVADIRLAPGCVFSKPCRAEKAEAFLKGKRLTDELARKAGEAVSKEMIERTGIRWSTEYKKPAIEALTERALKQIMRLQ